MKYELNRGTVLAAIAIVLLCCFAGVVLPIVVGIVFVSYYLYKLKEAKEPQTFVYTDIGELETKYGEPNDVVVLDASRANDLSALILFYSAQDVAIIAGEELKMSDMVGVMAKNMATPYTIDEYAVIISTKNPLRPTIYLRVGYDAGLANEIAAQIDTHLQHD